MTGYEPEDPSEAPTGYYDYSGEKQGSPQRSTWYRNPIVLIALGLFVAILLGVALYFLADQTNSNGGTTQTPTSPTTSTTSADVGTTTAPVAPPETTTMTTPPSTTEPTTTAPTTTAPTTTATTTVDEGHHHHHHRDDGTP